MDQERPITQEEKLYLYPQSELVGWHAGFIGYLRANLGTDGTRFPTAWNDFDPRLKTPEFSRMLDRVILDRRAVGEMFRNRDSLRRAVEAHPEWVVDRDRGYSALRVDAGKYAFLFRLTPQADEHNLHCFCYLKKSLGQHIRQARRGIRFLDPSGVEKFRIQDGDAIRITDEAGSKLERICRYVDDDCMEAGRNLCDVRLFAERMERLGATVIPLRSSLPKRCYTYVRTENVIGVIQKGESGYYRTDLPVGTPEEAAAQVDAANGCLGVTKAQAAAMQAGSMVGWDTPAADPKNYDDHAAPIRPARKPDKGLER